LDQATRFEWNWVHANLPADHFFDLRVWPEANEDMPKTQRKGIAPLTKGTTVEVDLAGAGLAGTYYWTVIVVKKSCDNCAPVVAGEWGQERKFTFSQRSRERATKTPIP
jgi:hypothetical protein